MKNLVCLLVLLMLVACGPTARLVQLESRFATAEAERLLEVGSNTITGSAVIRQRGGGTVNCAGNNVFLIPATAYALERIQSIYGSTEQGYSPFTGFGPTYEFEPDPPAYHQNIRTEQCDAQGMFEFSSIADGRFFVITTIVWEAGNQTHGGNLMRSVSLSGGQSKRIVLSP